MTRLVSWEDTLAVHREPPLAWLVINRPAAHNALNSEVWKGLAAALGELASAAEIRVIILRGAGSKAFVSGADIGEFSAIRADAGMADAYDQLTARAWLALTNAPQPVIAMINGLCYGGGVSLALACDLRLAADHARFAVPAVRLGLSYPMQGGVERLVQVVGPTHAADILLSGRAVDAHEAWRIGLVNRVVASAELETVTRDYALAMAEGAPLTLAAHKRALQESLRPAADRDARSLHEAMRKCFDSADYKEGIAAFVEKRKPKFEGR